MHPVGCFKLMSTLPASPLIATEAVAEQVASFLLDLEAVKLRPHQPFTWASGWKSPIYCDNRVTLSYPAVRQFLKESLFDLYKEHFFDVSAIAGVATAGIPMASLLADEASLPLLYVRSAPKGHGMENLIEGRLHDQANVAVVEDLISTGGSSLKAVAALTAAGAEVAGMLALFTYGFEQATTAFGQAKVKLATLSDYNTLIKVAVDKKLVEEADLELLNNWRLAPDRWGK